jgi:hypothetical protein
MRLCSISALCSQQFNGKPLPDRLRCGPEAASVDRFAFLVESAVMAPDIAKVDADRRLRPGLSAWGFRDEVLRRFLHGNSLSLPEDLLISFTVSDL